MDDTSDCGYSRAPHLEDLIALCRSLNECGAKYVLIGGFAVILHGFVRGTKDIDFLIDVSVQNMRKIKQALSKLPDNAISLIEDNEVEKYSVVRIADEIVIDLMAKACAIDFTEASHGIDRIIVEGVEIPVANKEMLIRMKDTVRPSDKVDVQFLQLSLEEEKRRK